MSERVCFNCGKPGHSAAACPEAKDLKMLGAPRAHDIRRSAILPPSSRERVTGAVGLPSDEAPAETPWPCRTKETRDTWKLH